MCGIVGFLHHEYSDTDATHLIQNLMHGIAHRGPDQDGVEIGAQFAFGHRRLSIIDLSEQGRQPFRSEDQRFILSYNGEIYNYIELRAELEGIGYHFRTKTDTEVLLSAWIEWGQACLNKLVGMFAFAILDRHTNDIWLARDAFGIKPLFYMATPSVFAFSSELPALVNSFGKTAEMDVDWDTAYHYLHYGEYDAGENTFIANIKSLQAGHVIKLSAKEWLPVRQQCWWQAEIKAKSTLTSAEAVAKARDLFLQNIKLHLRSDAKIALSLSGGLDSSALAYGMRHVAPDMPIHSFSYISDDEALSEEPWIDRVNQDIGATGHKIYLQEETLTTDINDCIKAQGEPMGGASILAQYLISREMQKQGFKVVLEGQGADEIFGGYQGYPGQRIRSFIESYQPVKAVQFAWRWAKWPRRSLPLAFKLYLAEILPDFIYDFARTFAKGDVSQGWLSKSFAQEIQLDTTRKRHQKARIKGAKSRRLTAQLCYQISHRGLPHLLRHSDRNTMRHSIESRVPFLTTDFADLMMSLPENELVSDAGETKSLMRKMLAGLVPADIAYRRDKIGFETPDDKIASQLIPLIEQLAEDSTALPPLFDKAFFKGGFQDQLASQTLTPDFIWRIYNFLYWHAWFKSGMHGASPAPHSGA